MGDVHVHTAPHAYEANGYGLWALGDNSFAAVYFGLFLHESQWHFGSFVPFPTN